MSEMVITKENFKESVLDSSEPVLIDFWAAWCGPCRMMAPVIESIAQEYSGKVKVGKVNVDEQPELASTFGITGIPTVMVFKDGKAVNTAVGYRPKGDIENMLKQFI